MKDTDFSRRKFISTGAIAMSGLSAFGYSGISLAGLNRDDIVRIGLIGSGSRVLHKL